MLKPTSTSLRLRVTLGVVVPLFVILGLITIIQYTRYRATALQNASVLASHSGQVIESSLRHAMVQSDFTEVQALLDTMGEMKEFEVMYLLDTSGNVIFAPNGTGVGTKLDNQSAECRPCHILPAGERPSSIIVSGPAGDRVFRSMQPIVNGPECTQCHNPEDKLLGLLLTDLSMAPLESTLRADFYEHLMWWGITLLVSVVVVNIILSRFVLSRLENLSGAIQRFGHDQRLALPASLGSDEIGQLGSAFETMAHQVQARSEENRLLSESLRQQSGMRGELLKRLITAQEDERRRVARELHDDLGQSLGGLSFQVEALQRLIEVDPARARSQVAPIRALIADTTDRMYELILALRPSALDDLGLESALSAYAQKLLPERGITYRLNTEGLQQRLPPTLEITLYRLFQEALNNVVRHSGASHVEISLIRRDAALEASICDNGRGFDPAAVRSNGQHPRGLGLLGMEERVLQCGGQITLTARPGDGTRIEVCIPLDKETTCE